MSGPSGWANHSPPGSGPIDPSLTDEDASALTADALAATGLKAERKKGEVNVESGYLLFLSRRQLDNIAAAALEATRAGRSWSR